MDREIEQTVRTKRTARRVVVAVLAAAALIFCVAATVSWLRPSVRRTDLQIARVERGTVDATLQAAGTVVPEIETVISSPVEARTLRIQHCAGDRLHAGDAILTLDTSATKLDLDKLNDAVAQKESALAQARLKAEEDIASAGAALERAVRGPAVDDGTRRRQYPVMRLPVPLHPPATPAPATCRAQPVSARPSGRDFDTTPPAGGSSRADLR